MDLLQLQYFKVTAKYEHMTRAAEELMVSQPALSKTIARLEEYLGTPLFDREGRSIRLNEFGKTFLERVNRIFIEIEEGEKEIKDRIDLQTRSASISITLPHILPFFIVEYLKKNPSVHIKQFSSSSDRMRKQLENAEIDFCISLSPIYGEDIEWMPLLEEEIFLSVPENHPLAKRKSIKLKEVSHETFINRTSGYGFRDLTDQFCRDAGFEPFTPIEVEEAGTILRLVELGIGISFTPQLSLIRRSLPKTVQLPISNPICKRTIGIAWKKSHYFSLAALDFKNFTIAFFKNKALAYYNE